MQFTLTTFAKLSIIAAVVNVVGATALPELLSLEARQVTNECLLKPCSPPAISGCCDNAVCVRVFLPGYAGVCTPPTCPVICSTTADCCTDVPNTRFACQLIPNQTVGVCVPQTIGI